MAMKYSYYISGLEKPVRAKFEQKMREKYYLKSLYTFWPSFAL